MGEFSEQNGGFHSTNRGDFKEKIRGGFIQQIRGRSARANMRQLNQERVVRALWRVLLRGKQGEGVMIRNVIMMIRHPDSG